MAIIFLPQVMAVHGPLTAPIPVRFDVEEPGVVLPKAFASSFDTATLRLRAEMMWDFAVSSDPLALQAGDTVDVQGDSAAEGQQLVLIQAGVMRSSRR